MSYDYNTQRENLFTDKGQRLFIAMRDRVKDMLEYSGAVSETKAISNQSEVGAISSWDMIACLDRMVELGELHELTKSKGVGERVYVSARHCRGKNQ